MNMARIDRDELRAEKRHDGHCDDIGREESEHHSQGKCCEQVFADANE
jgi:hypothetical protein